MKRSVILLIFISLIAVAYFAFSPNLKGSSQDCKSTLVVHSTPNTTGKICFPGGGQTPFVTDGSGNYTYPGYLCEGKYTICVDGQGYEIIYIDGTERTYEVTVNNGWECPC